MNLIFYSFSIPETFGYILIGILITLFTIQFIKTKRKEILCLVCIPIVLFVLVITKIAPFINIRYISPVLPIIAIAILLITFRIMNHILEYMIQKQSKVAVFCKKNGGLILTLIITVGISTYGLYKFEPQFLYKDYTKRIEIAEQYHDLKFVYIGESPFNHLQDMEEFLRYDNTLIVNTWELDVLKNNPGLENENEFILNIKCWVSNFDQNLEKVLEYTGAIIYFS